MRVMLGVHGRGEHYDRLLTAKVLPELRVMYPWDDVRRSDSHHEPYNRAASRNVLAQDALDGGFDVMVIGDADSIPDPQPLKDAIQGAYEDGLVHIPFDTVRVIHPKHADSPGQGYRRARPTYSYGPSCGGIFVVRPDRWVYAGGMDERIVGWGYEDQIFLVSIRTFLGNPVYHAGRLYNFNHPRGGEVAHQAENVLLRDLFNQNLGDKAKIRLLQVGSNRWTGLDE